MENSKLYDYTGRPLEDNEVLVLMPYDELDMKVNRDENKKCVVTVWSGGHPVKGVWKAVPKEWAEEARAQFNTWVRDTVPAPTEGRCLIPQPDGTKKPCPRKKGDNRVSCAACPHRCEYDREIIAPVSINQMMDDFEYDPIPGDDSAEDQFIAIEEEREAQQFADDVINRLAEASPKHALAAKLMARGISGEQFANELKLGHECANRVRKQVQALAESGITSFSQVKVDSLKANHTRQDEYYRRRLAELGKMGE